jgi:hypothetical protein
MVGRVDVKAGLWIAHSNQKHLFNIQIKYNYFFTVNKHTLIFGN